MDAYSKEVRNSRAELKSSNTAANVSTKTSGVGSRLEHLPNLRSWGTGGALCSESVNCCGSPSCFLSLFRVFLLLGMTYNSHLSCLLLRVCHLSSIYMFSVSYSVLRNGFSIRSTGTQGPPLRRRGIVLLFLWVFFWLSVSCFLVFLLRFFDFVGPCSRAFSQCFRDFSLFRILFVCTIYDNTKKCAFRSVSFSYLATSVSRQPLLAPSVVFCDNNSSQNMFKYGEIFIIAIIGSQ